MGSLFKSIANAFKKVASLLVGLPLGAAGAVFFGVMYGVASFADAVALHIKKQWKKGRTTQAIRNPITEGFKNAMHKALYGSIEFAFDSEIVVARFLNKKVEDKLSETGGEILNVDKVIQADPKNAKDTSNREINDKTKDKPPSYEEAMRNPPPYRKTMEDHPPPYKEKPNPRIKPRTTRPLGEEEKIKPVIAK